MNEIFALEHSNDKLSGNCTMHLVRDRTFFQAYEYSAYFMEKHFRKYKIHSRFFKNINAEMVYMGFPKNNLEPLKRDVESSGYVWKQIDENRIDVIGFPCCKNFEEWKTQKMSYVDEPVPFKPRAANDKSMVNAYSADIPQNNLMLASRESYDICLYVCNRSSEFLRNYRFGLGEKLRAESVELTEHFHLVLTKVLDIDLLYVRKLLGSMRIKMRLLSDLGQLNGKQWFYFNEKVERMYELLRLESPEAKAQGSEPVGVGDQLAPQSIFADVQGENGEE